MHACQGRAGIRVTRTETATMMMRECRLQAHIKVIFWSDSYVVRVFEHEDGRALMVLSGAR